MQKSVERDCCTFLFPVMQTTNGLPWKRYSVGWFALWPNSTFHASEQSHVGRFCNRGFVFVYASCVIVFIECQCFVHRDCIKQSLSIGSARKALEITAPAISRLQEPEQPPRLHRFIPFWSRFAQWSGGCWSFCSRAKFDGRPCQVYLWCAHNG